VASCYTDARFIEIDAIVARSYNVKGLTSLWSVPDVSSQNVWDFALETLIWSSAI